VPPCGVTTLAVSDVVGDDPAAIGSGPTVADPTTFADAAAVIEDAGCRSPRRCAITCVLAPRGDDRRRRRKSPTAAIM
jgi:glycerate 2-kinase (EC 2.7.1.-)